MKKWLLLNIIVLIVCIQCNKKSLILYTEIPKQPIVEIPKELRGIWITRFEWAHPDPDTMKQNIKSIMQQVADMNYNTVFFQVRGQAETLYPSPLEPWSKLIHDKIPDYDPVELAVKEAHQHGLIFYAYVNLLTLWNEENPPSNPKHLYFNHGPKVDPDSSWVCFDSTANPMKINEYYYLNPALPEVNTYLKHVIKHFVESYNIDGIHFDRIRYPGPYYVFDPYSKEQFRIDSLNNPISRSDWARQQLTDLVENVVSEALLIKPYLVISAAVWGMYRTKDIPGYEKFGSGYDAYYQDAIGWLETGIMDFIVPMIYWDISDPKPNLNELWDNFKSRTTLFPYIIPGIRLKPQWMSQGENISQIDYLRKNNALGHVMFSYSMVAKNPEKKFHHIIYPNKVIPPQPLKRIDKKQIVGLNIKNLATLKNQRQRIRISPFSRTKSTDSEGWFGMIIPDLPTRLNIEGYNLDTRRWQIPFNYVIQSDTTIFREMPWIEFRKYPLDITTASSFDLLCKTQYPAQVYIQNDSVKTYKTGIFFKTVPLNLGSNRIGAKAYTSDFDKVMYEIEVARKPQVLKAAIPLWIDTLGILPDTDHELLNSDRVLVRFNGSRGQRGFVEINPGKKKIPLMRRDNVESSQYYRHLSLADFKTNKIYRLTFILESMADRSKEKIKYPGRASLRVRQPQTFPMVMTTREDALFRYNLGQIRLGGPIISEFPKGIILQVNGEIGDNYRIFLNEIETGFIEKKYVEIYPETTDRPFYYIKSVHASPGENEDIISIPYPQSVPYAVYPEPNNKMIKIKLYGVKSSSTWMVHKSGLKYVDLVTWNQVTPETYQIIIHLKDSKIWGYTCQPDGDRLYFRIKHPPVIREDSLFKGIILAVEAGHGGDNTGAIGLSGLPEKNLNLAVAKKLVNIASTAGMEVLQVREADSYMDLSSKRTLVENSNAHLLVSIHANASGGQDGYLGVSGASTYYNNPFWAEFAEIVNNKLLELDLKEFGTVGSFNYRVIRMSSRPAILVEQAFLSNAEDEEKLASEIFQEEMAQKIFEGIAEFIQYMESHQ